MSNTENPVRKSVEIPRDLYESFIDIYPQYGAFTWFITETLRSFVNHHSLSPQDQVDRAVAAVLEIEESD